MIIDYILELLLAVLLLCNVFLVYWNARNTRRLFELNSDCIEVMSATEKVLEHLQWKNQDYSMEVRLAIGQARDSILQKIELLAKK